MNPIKYDELIEGKIKTLDAGEKKEVYDFADFLSLKKLKPQDTFMAALREGQTIGKKMGVTPADIAKEIKQSRKKQ